MRNDGQYSVKIGDTLGYIDDETVQRAKKYELYFALGFLHGRVREDRSAQQPQVTLVDGNIKDFFEKIDAIKAEAEKVRTPLTRESLAEWAKNEAETIDRLMKEHCDPCPPSTTPQAVLVQILMSLEQETAGSTKDRAEAYFELMLDGTKGFKNLTFDEALDEIAENMIGPDAEAFEFADLEELLEQFYERA